MPPVSALQACNAPAASRYPPLSLVISRCFPLPFAVSRYSYNLPPYFPFTVLPVYIICFHVLLPPSSPSITSAHISLSTILPARTIYFHALPPPLSPPASSASMLFVHRLSRLQHPLTRSSSITPPRSQHPPTRLPSTVLPVRTTYLYAPLLLSSPPATPTHTSTTPTLRCSHDTASLMSMD
jgi:hypothetical protein